MKKFKADLHIHTTLSPCGDLYMSPVNIIAEATLKKLDLIGITDHNTTRHCRVVKKMAEKAGIKVLTGAEITTREEIHCLTFFENNDTLEEFQKFIDSRLPDVMNNPGIFGDQVEVDENENIVYTEPKLLHNALDVTIDELERIVHRMDGLFIPAHIDRMKNSIFSQLGFMPEGLYADALEISSNSRSAEFLHSHPEINGYAFIRSSDAHFKGQIGGVFTTFFASSLDFSEIKLALKNKEGRRTII